MDRKGDDDGRHSNTTSLTIDEIIGFWINSLGDYKPEALSASPAPGSWSIGQLYLHLVNDTRYFAEQIKSCLSHNDHLEDQPVPAAATMLDQNKFPDQSIEGHPDNGKIPQPTGKQELVDGLLAIREEMRELEQQIVTSRFKGKTRHPGLGYFGADEWFRFAGMHFRHHLRQKKRIDQFLQQTGLSNQGKS